MAREPKLNRRKFIALSSAGLGIAASGLSAAALGAKENAEGNATSPAAAQTVPPDPRAAAGQVQLQYHPGGRRSPDLFKAFIVSDAHFGMLHPVQPESSQVCQAIGNIIGRFPDLDVFIDSGDSHHSSATDRDRGNWWDNVSGAVGLLPFFLCAGNHEIDSYGDARKTGCPDVEERTMRHGSIECRPYYSFDLKGIHVAILPQLMDSNIVTDEALEWLRLDLELNRDRTAFIVTHNALRDTTRHHDSIRYRSVANSAQVRSLIDGFPNLLSWMHGHNHTWELVEQSGKYYVSNGRIGGFTPNGFEGKVGDGHLGGIYVEIGPNHFTVRGYSASEGCFFDELPGYSHMARTMKRKTSFDAAAPPCISYGMGGALDGQRAALHQHHLPGPVGRQELFLAGTTGPDLNHNSRMTHFTEDTTGGFRGRMVPGFDLPSGDIGGVMNGWEFLNPGVRLMPPENSGDTRSLFAPSLQVAQACYYRCVPGKNYLAQLNLRGEGAGFVQLVGHFFNSHMAELGRKDGPLTQLTGGDRTVSLEFAAPMGTTPPTLYEDPASPLDVQLAVEARFSKLASPVRVTSFAIQMDGTGPKTIEPSLRVAGSTHRCVGTLEPGQYQRFEIPQPLAAREVLEVGAQGSRRQTFLIRQSGLQWQVRNAAVAVVNGVIEVGPLRNRFSDRHEIVIVPFAAPEGPFVHRMLHVNRARIHPFDPGTKLMRIELLEFTGDYAEVDILNCPGPLAKIDGVLKDGVFSPARSFFGFRPATVGAYEFKFR
jgi:hypothetical protein